MGDNCTANDTLVNSFIQEAAELGFNVDPERGRCFAHVLNLCAKELLSNLDMEPHEINESIIVNQLENGEEVSSEQLEDILARDGFSGGYVQRLRSIVLFIHASPQRLHRFRAVVASKKSFGSRAIPTLDFAVRWNSTSVFETENIILLGSNKRDINIIRFE
ncbi:hypothetical protein SAMD00019534_126720 [Acytostelium subglobosum LB1]|uniref:hypothetical protein n=1 Tax=Acytostelium subglobosum LB1 TaxID=1410327 RepID=UPI0006450E08|nr:hypothetical protein SAMD00019534_126720 [Acytostelium subglobosum LB1]GAM29496.1 hypothetical protein SAMD00019534_126720 [Acytostelium subglobosum LB1]|eukprot:XP_012747556.1 hypothetical protein SAMD00019534_126720 [Acytostelium subglobosum LB1]